MNSSRGNFQNWLRTSTSGLCVVAGGDAELVRHELSDAVVLHARGLTVSECARRLAASLTPTATVARMHDLAVALDDRDGGTVSVLIEGLDEARDPFAVAGTVALRLGAAPIGLRVVVTVAPGAEVLAVLPAPLFTADRVVPAERASLGLGGHELPLSVPSGPSAAETHRRIAEALWTDDSRYAHAFLAGHAALGGVLDDLLADDAVLDRLDQRRLAEEVEVHYRGRPDRPANAAAIVAARGLLADAAPEQRRAVRAFGVAHTGVAADPAPGAIWWPRWVSHRTAAWLTRLDGHRAYVGVLATVPMPGGRTLLASGCGDGVIRLWDPVSAEQFGGPMKATHHEITSLGAARRPDGRTVLASACGVVQIWDPVRTEPIAEVPDADGDLLAVLTRPDGSDALAVVVGDAFCLADPATGELIGLPFGDGGKYAHALLTVERSGRDLVAVRLDRTMTVWDPETGERVARTDGEDDLDLRVRGVFHRSLHGLGGGPGVPWPDGRTLTVSGGDHDDMLYLSDRATGVTVAGAAIEGPGLTKVVAAIPLPEGRTVVAANTGHRIWLWDPFPAAGRPGPGGHAARTVRAGAGPAVAPDDAYRCEPVWRFRHEKLRDLRLTWVGDAPAVAAVARAGTVGVWNAEDGAPLLTFTAHPGGVNEFVTATIDGRPVVVTIGTETPEADGEDDDEDDEDEGRQFVKVWDPATGAPVFEPVDLGDAPPIFDLGVFEVEGIAMVTGGWNGEDDVCGGVDSWILQNGRDWRRYAFSSVSEDCACAVRVTTVDGRAAIVAAMTDRDADDDGSDDGRDDRLVGVWDALTGRLLGPGFHVRADPSFLESGVEMAVATVADRPAVAYWERDGRIRLRRLPDGTPVGALRPERPEQPRSMRAARLGEIPVLLVVEDGGVVSVWNLDTMSCLARPADLGKVVRAELLPDGLLIALTGEEVIAARLVR